MMEVSRASARQLYREAEQRRQLVNTSANPCGAVENRINVRENHESTSMASA
jgi:hypothetical protein